jgi:DNA-binding response OmpR family regulator
MDGTMNTLAVRRVAIRIDGTGRAGGRVATRRVLFVSGDADLRAAAARVLSAHGYHVVTAAHSGHAQLACRAARRAFDILITELALDDMPGPALTQRLRREQPAIRAVYLADPGTPRRDGLVVRPFTREDLLMELHAASGDATSTAS